MAQVLPGFREFYPEEGAVRRYIFDQWTTTVRAYGFQEIEPPILEPLELFTEKSGPEIAEQLFHFVDKGGRAVALRPELTPSVVRMVAAKAQALRRPIKWFNIGEQFRFERPQKGRLRSFYQLNVDCFGIADESADAEVLALLIQIFRDLELTEKDIQLHLSDRTLWFAFLESQGLQDENLQKVLGVVDKMGRDPEEKSLAKLKDVVGESAEDLWGKIKALVAARDLSELKSIFSTLQNALVQESLLRWELLFERLGAMNCLQYVKVDLGIVRGLAYYTGFVFEVFETSGQMRALAGGGRYDGLVEKLGGPSMPAIGFGVGDVVLTLLLEEKGLLPPAPSTAEVVAVFTGKKEEQVALRLVQELRAHGVPTEYLLGGGTVAKQMKFADQSKASWVIFVGEEELKANQVKLRNMEAHEEMLIDESAVVAFLLGDDEDPSLEFA